MGQGFQHEGGRICGIFVAGGLLLSLYFPTKGPKQSVVQYRESFTTFVDDLINVVEQLICGCSVSWIACGADLNAHFVGSGLPPRRNDDFAAKQVRRFMVKFDLVSLAEEMCPERFTCLNSRGGASCLDTFLVSVWLYKSGAVTLYEVLDFVEHGSDRSPVYLRLRVQPTWINIPNLPKRRILKRSGIESLRKRLGINSGTRPKIVSKIVSAFSHLEWSKANTRHDMDVLWEHWLKSYNTLTEDLIGTRWARVSSWGRKFDMDIRKLCLKASIARA